MFPNGCSVSLSDNLENIGGNIDLCIIISNVSLFTEPVGVVLFGNELAWFCDNNNWHVPFTIYIRSCTPLVQKPK